ncbi:long-chain-fatty-acid--CoA ligase [Burkholderia vietnamiensis]|uniref:Long-chain-fatty-acid--CoA ligase n=1 Tax=Burkholderia vietnamiensis TaxID=60552 RepID=A0AAW7SYU4_BURVI|nr:long-chain-fatty-acid--CoA ligase [Burkholderia vietnamiensis]MBH9645873.1 long-chain-fatty-acid--CoA ligase [Burkholderia vietnamiensis]MBR8008818.1 long-chain-fatty-acid--CoA ligase [Burkholderia vietnamiensis]MDN7551323.1 long-chain-fatty-acid--CoA ligase [Burkholderia vietnamiensis]MDN7795137.1 long-chain-fatty-acid--CoA ligase [Burkholderia vietnamiensis]MDN8045137.1 long-chain-fatty-acid--CoA ligase [Burkholderia vietnamiensis]
MDSYLTQPLHKALRECPDATAVTSQGRDFSYREFVGRVARLAAVLRAEGLEAGERVGMIALNSHYYLEYLYGTWWAGGTVNPVNIRWTPQEVACSLDDCDTRILLVDDAFKAMVPTLRALSGSLRTVIYVGASEVPDGAKHYEDLLAQTQPVLDVMRQGHALAAVMYTGGTTGQPKGVMLSHANIVTCALGCLVAIPRGPQSVALVTAPLFHIGGCALLLQAVQNLQRVVMVPMFDEKAVLEAIQAYRATEIFLVPLMLRRLLDYPAFKAHDLSSLRLLTYGASPIDGTLLERALAQLPEVGFYQAYGMTECAPVITVLPAEAHLPGYKDGTKVRSAGLPITQVEMRIVDGEGRDVPPGTVGELLARGPMVMRGYWNKPHETAQALSGGWMRTGDGAYQDEDGYVFVVDRVKDMIVTGGENVYSAEVENAIARMPQVLQSAVVGIPDEQFGERVHAVIVLRAGETLTEDAVVQHCRDLIAGYKVPRSVEFRDTLPTSAAGKLLKHELRKPFWQGRLRAVN